jgi:hypothetical protein
MITRRTFALGAATAFAAPSAYLAFAHTGAWTRLKRNLLDSKCAADCFSLDWKQFGYEEYYGSLFDLSRSDQLKPVATGPAIRTEIQEAFGGSNLHAARENSLDILQTERFENFTLHRLRFILDSRVPVIGCVAVPSGVPRGLVLLAHGMQTTPERCFNRTSPDYMCAIGARLCDAGFAVWCPFMPQAGNAPSQGNLAGMLALDGISYHNIICSSLNLGPWVLSQMHRPDLRVVRYGVSWGSVVAATLEAATSARAPSVLSGYLRDEGQLVSSEWIEDRASQPFLTYLHLLPNSVNYFFPNLAKLLRPCPLYFEVGSCDTLNSNAFGRDDAFAKIRSAYREVQAADAIAFEVFEGGHEVAGTEAIKWLSAQV